MKCELCAYQWKEETDRHPVCHWVQRGPDDIPPCEEEAYWDEDDDERDYWEDLNRQYRED